MSQGIRKLELERAAPWFIGLFLLASIAFWPSYLSQISSWATYTHLHAATAALWIGLLIAQPLAIRARRMDLHRMVGRASFIIAPVVVLVILLRAHHRLQGLTGVDYAIQTYILYLQVSLSAMFTLCYLLAILNRRNTPVHSRFMVCTAFTLIDPIVIRLMFWVDPTPEWNYQWLTFGLTDLVIITLIWLDRDSRNGRWVFPVMLVAFVLSQLPALLGVTSGPGWQAFARWYAALGQ